MRWLINYIRSCFCKHDWELLNTASRYQNSTSDMPYAVIHVYRCKKCGYAKKYKI